MPQIPFNSKNRAVRAGQLDKLTLAYSEIARIVLLDNPIFRYVHQLRAPQIVDGKPVQVAKKKRGKGDGGSEDTYMTYEMDFIGRPFCLGSDEALSEKGVDPDGCPACRRSVDSNQVKAPERRFAVNVVRYHLDSNGKAVTPFSCAVIPWAFNESTFDKLISIAEEYQASGGLIGRDLRLGPCTSKDFQNFDITPGDQSWWASSQENKERVLATFKANRKTEQELESLCGRAVTASWLADDLGKIADKWRVVDSGGVERPDATAAVDRSNLTEGLQGLQDLLNTPAPAAPPPAPTPAATTPDELNGLLGDVPAPAAPSASAITPTVGGETVGFNLLDELNKLG
jgi:hypothetical protein